MTLLVVWSGKSTPTLTLGATCLRPFPCPHSALDTDHGLVAKLCSVFLLMLQDCDVHMYAARIESHLLR
jgi:hypothetical protein